MQPNGKTIEEFRRLYEAKFGEELTQEEAVEIWTRVMDLYLVLYHASDEKVRTRETTRDSLNKAPANR